MTLVVREPATASSTRNESCKNLLAKGEVVILPMPPLMNKTSGQKSQVILTMISDTEVLIANVGIGSCVVDLLKPVHALQLITLCLPIPVTRQLVDALNVQRGFYG